jgi:hypothetical protein
MVAGISHPKDTAIGLVRDRPLQPHALRNRSAHTLQAIEESAVVIVLVPEIEYREDYQRGHESSHGRFSVADGGLVHEPAFCGHRRPEGSPGPEFAFVRRAHVVERVPCSAPMRLGLIGKPQVRQERICIVGAADPISARLGFQFHWGKGHS